MDDDDGNHICFCKVDNRIGKDLVSMSECGNNAAHGENDFDVELGMTVIIFIRNHIGPNSDTMSIFSVYKRRIHGVRNS